VLVLDSGATHNVFRNEILLSNVRECTTLTVEGVGGELTVHKVGRFGDLTDVYLCPPGPANTASVPALTQDLQATVKFDEASAIVQLPGARKILALRVDDLYLIQRESADSHWIR
jgi:hypothetical protein